MMMVYTFFFCSVIILNSIELSFQSRNPSTASPRIPQSLEEHPIRVRDRSPPERPSSPRILGYSLKKLGYIRLISRTNSNLIFQFRKYVFPAGKPIRLRTDERKYIPLPTQEQIVLSTSNGDIFATLEYSGLLRGIYTTNKSRSRVKINMISEAIEDLTPYEILDCPVGKNHPFFYDTFTEAKGNSDSLQYKSNLHNELDPGSSSSGRHLPDRKSPQGPAVDTGVISTLGRPPSHHVLGFALTELGYIRLIPKTNRERQFEFRKYILPANKGIHLLVGNREFIPAPIQEYIVLSTSEGDVFAILEYTEILRGMYKRDKYQSRMKINMISGDVVNMTKDEMKECNVGKFYRISPRLFTKVVANNDSMQTVYQ